MIRSVSQKLAKIKKKQHETEQAQQELARVGLNENGEKLTLGWNEKDYIKEKAIKHIDNILQAVEKAHTLTNNYDSEVELIIWGADTLGVIYGLMAELLGNGNSLLKQVDTSRQIEYKK